MSLIYNAASPIFEPPDESTHFRYVKYLLDHGKLPAVVDGPNREDVWGLHQPPLYFLISAVMVSPFELQAPSDYLDRNPHINRGFATRPGNKNFYIHTADEAFPYRGFPLVVRYMRLLSTVFGMGTLIVVYATGLALFAGRRLLALAAPALMAIHPEFVFINASIANEPLNILLMAAGLWSCIRLIQRGPSTRLALFLGVVAGLIAVTKMTGLALIFLIVVAMLLTAIRIARYGQSAIPLWRFGVIVAGLLSLLGGWWYVFNVQTYGDPFQANMYRDFYSNVQSPITFRDWTGGIAAGEVSFWAAFGWFNILVPEWMYTFYKTFVRVGLLGVSVYWLRLFLNKGKEVEYLDSTQRFSPPPQPSPFQGEGATFNVPTPYSSAPHPPTPTLPTILLIASPLISALILTRLIATEGGIQGRQLLPMLPALALLMVIGYRALLPRGLFAVVAVGLSAFMAALLLIIPFQVIAPAYAHPNQLTEDALPAHMISLERSYDNQIKLHGYTLDMDTVAPGEVNAITLYWQALQPIKQNYTVFVHALGRQLQKVGEYNGYSGLGTFPTSNWPVGPIIEDRIEFIIDPAAEGPTLLRLNIGFFDADRLDLPPLLIRDARSQEVSALVTQQLLVDGQTTTEPKADCIDISVNFADNINLRCYVVDSINPTSLTLYWQADALPANDYTIFIQLWQDGQQVAGFDGPPLSGDLPTSVWQPSYALVDKHELDVSQLLPGSYTLFVGLYNPQTGERVPAIDGDGTILADYAVDLGNVMVE